MIRKEDFAVIKSLNRRDVYLKDITAELGVHPKTVRRALQRDGAWELIPRPASLQETVKALSHADPTEFQQERNRFREHRDRFRLHTRSVKHSQFQLYHLEQR